MAMTFSGWPLTRLAWLAAGPARPTCDAWLKALKVNDFRDGDVLSLIVANSRDLALAALLASRFGPSGPGEMALLFPFPPDSLNASALQASLSFRLLEAAFSDGRVRGCVHALESAREYARFLAWPLAVESGLRSAWGQPEALARYILDGPAAKPLAPGDKILICYPASNLNENKAGNATRERYLAKILASYRLVFFCPEQTCAEPCPALPPHEIRCYPLSHGMPALSVFWQAARISFKLLYFVTGWESCHFFMFKALARNRPFRLLLVQALIGARAAIVEYPFHMALIAPCVRALRAPILLTAHDRHAPLLAPSLRRPVDRLEKEAAGLADAFFTVAREEHEYFKACGYENILAPSAADSNFTLPQPETFQTLKAGLAARGLILREPFTLFVGSDNPPNREAKANLRTLAYEAAERGLPWSFVVAGGVGRPEESRGNFLALGPVGEEILAALYEHCALILSPLFQGSGASVKTVEAMVRGKAIFGSSVTFRGLPVANGRECFLEDDLARYLSRLEGLLTDTEGNLAEVENRARELGRRFDYRVCLKPYVDFLESWGKEKESARC